MGLSAVTCARRSILIQARGTIPQVWDSARMLTRRSGSRQALRMDPSPEFRSSRAHSRTKPFCPKVQCEIVYMFFQPKLIIPFSSSSPTAALQYIALANDIYNSRIVIHSLVNQCNKYEMHRRVCLNVIRCRSADANRVWHLNCQLAPKNLKTTWCTFFALLGVSVMLPLCMCLLSLIAFVFFKLICYWKRKSMKESRKRRTKHRDRILWQAFVYR